MSTTINIITSSQPDSTNFSPTNANRSGASDAPGGANNGLTTEPGQFAAIVKRSANGGDDPQGDGQTITISLPKDQAANSAYNPNVYGGNGQSAKTITINIDKDAAQGNADNASAAKPDRSPNGALNIQSNGGADGQGLHPVKLSSDKGTVQVLEDSKGNVYDKSGKSIGKKEMVNGKPEYTFDSGKSEAATVLSTGGTNGKNQTSGRQTFGPGELTSSAGNLRGSKGEKDDLKTTGEIEQISQYGSVNTNGHTVVV
ncbi:hypothetical protein BLA23254_06750 [Burkholderia lata]|uniref:Uncharacterized protein n=1 Tax=Burkholderia lata (strain ATCC 17760 / DSM 23089 / LMG 22485 / NCIMB 9086 / R18194 / 383) TaxID=482957 RepID=A0A6P2S083_BURL3|nr:hypothetical protein [Burkholderia lata]VWC37911.1 hypothetical protein BLA23254_06750 [Burkholderia lata]